MEKPATSIDTGRHSRAADGKPIQTSFSKRAASDVTLHPSYLASLVDDVAELTVAAGGEIRRILARFYFDVIADYCTVSKLKPMGAA